MIRKAASKHVNAFFVFVKPQYKLLTRPRVKSNKIFRGIKYPGVVYKNIEPGPTRFHKSKFTLLYIGRFAIFKNISYLLKAVDILDSEDIESSLSIVGYGRLEEELKHMAKKMQLKNIKAKVSVLSFCRNKRICRTMNPKNRIFSLCKCI